MKKIFISHFTLLSSMAGVLVLLGGGVFYYRMGDNFFLALTILVMLLMVAVVLASIFLTLKSTKLLRSSGFGSCDGIENGEVHTRVSKSAIESILLANSFERSGTIYQRDSGFYRLGESNENFPLTRISLVDTDGIVTKLKLIGANSNNVAGTISILAFIGRELTEIGCQVSFLNSR